MSDRPGPCERIGIRIDAWIAWKVAELRTRHTKTSNETKENETV